MYIFRLYITKNTLFIGKTNNVSRIQNWIDNELKTTNDNFNLWRSWVIRNVGNEFYKKIKFEVLYKYVPNKLIDKVINFVYGNYKNTHWNNMYNDKFILNTIKIKGYENFLISRNGDIYDKTEKILMKRAEETYFTEFLEYTLIENKTLFVVY